MADLTDTQATDAVRIVGASNTGLEMTPVASSTNGDLQVQDLITSGSVNGAISVTTTATALRVGGSNLANRKVLMITPTNGTIYFGSSASVTVANGTPIFRNQKLVISAEDTVTLFAIGAGTVDVRVFEGA